ncbi:MAG: hypothetical protein ACRD2U_10980 [Terriglobales bacterium]
MSKIRSEKIRLSICPLELYDSTLDELSGIGIKFTYSDAFLKDLKAAVIADRLGLKSLDYARKTYLKDWERNAELDPNAFDLEMIRFLDSCIRELQRLLIRNSHNLIYSEIQQICDMTLLRSLWTLRVALDLCSKGLIHEVLALCRSSLEMIMWAFSIFDLPDGKDPFKFLPEKAVSGVKTYFPYVGRYYGYLSTFQHWRKETHSRAFNFEEEYSAVVYASGRNKWEAVANVMLMIRLYAEGYTAKYSSLKCKPDGKHCLPEIHAVSERVGRKQREWLKFLTKLEDQHVTSPFVDIFDVTNWG